MTPMCCTVHEQAKPASSGLKMPAFSAEVELASCKALASQAVGLKSLLRIVLGLLVHAGDRFRLYSSLLRLSPNRGIVCGARAC